MGRHRGPSPPSATELGALLAVACLAFAAVSVLSADCIRADGRRVHCFSDDICNTAACDKQGYCVRATNRKALNWTCQLQRKGGELVYGVCLENQTVRNTTSKTVVHYATCTDLCQQPTSPVCVSDNYCLRRYCDYRTGACAAQPANNGSKCFPTPQNSTVACPSQLTSTNSCGVCDSYGACCLDSERDSITRQCPSSATICPGGVRCPSRLPRNYCIKQSCGSFGTCSQSVDARAACSVTVSSGVTFITMCAAGDPCGVCTDVSVSATGACCGPRSTQAASRLCCNSGGICCPPNATTVSNTTCCSITSSTPPPKCCIDSSTDWVKIC